MGENDLRALNSNFISFNSDQEKTGDVYENICGNDKVNGNKQ